MITILVWTKDEPMLPIKYERIDFYHESRKALEIIQEEAYITTTTEIMKDSIIRYQIVEKRA